MNIELAGCVVDTILRKATKPDGTVERLTSRDAELLHYLAARPGQVVSRDTLLTEVWSYAPSVVSRAADNAVKRLRSKIERDPAHPEHLLTMHGEGYRFEPMHRRPAPAVKGPSKGVLQLTDVVVDLDHMQVYRDGQATSLTGIETSILDVLGSGRVVTREALRREVWNNKGGPASVNAAVARLRRKLGPDALVSVRGKGIRLCVPSPMTEDPDFVGREADLRQAQLAMASGTQLVTLVGPGGIGKTTLAQRVVGHGVWVDLADAYTQEEVVSSICAALSLVSTGDLPALLQRLGRVLVTRQPLVLDNCEQARPAVIAVLPTLLDAGVQVLCTSRIPLGLPIERRLVLDRLSEAAGAELYLRRADQACAGAAPPFERTDVEALIRAVDGIPLAIELAAARAALLPPRALLERLDLDVLRRPGARHETMRAAIQGSWDLLEPDEQQVLAVLARLPGGFTVALAERAVDLPDLIDRVQALRDASLLRVHSPGRLIPFHPVREFAREREVSDEALVSLIGALSVLADPEQLLRGRQQDSAAQRKALSDERLNFIALIPIAVRVAPEQAQYLALATYYLLSDSGPPSLGVRLVNQVIELATPALRSTLLQARSQFRHQLGELELARQDIDEAVALAPPQSAALATALTVSAEQYLRKQDYTRGLAAITSGAETAAKAGQPDVAAYLQAMAIHFGGGDREQAVRDAERSVTAATQLGNQRSLGKAALLLGQLHWLHGRPGLASRYLNEALRANQAIGLDGHNSTVRLSLCRILLTLGDHEGLDALINRNINDFQAVGHPDPEGRMFCMLGELRLRQGRLEEAAEALAASRRLHGEGTVLHLQHGALCDARLLIKRSDFSSAERLLDQCIGGLDAPGLTHARRTAMVTKAQLSLVTDDLAGAQELAGRLSRDAGEESAPELDIAIPAIQGLVALAGGSRGQAVQLLDEAVDAARRNGFTLATSPSIQQIEKLRTALDLRR